MPFKTNRPAGPLPALSGFSLLGFDGPEAASFLQAQTMNDVRGLAVQQWQWNGWLNAKGRVIALFALLKLEQDRFIAVLPDMPAGEFASLLKRFVFRTKVRIDVVTSHVAAAGFDVSAAPGDDGRQRIDGDIDNGLVLDMSGDDCRRQLLLLPSADIALAAPDAACDARWFAVDLAHGLPRLPPEQRETWTPQMLSLERLKAFSLNKGCYPGQEIVARTHYLGKAKRDLARVQGENLAVGAELRDEQETAIGSIVCATGDAREGLAVVQVDSLGSQARIDGRRVGLPGLFTGLQRPR